MFTPEFIGLVLTLSASVLAITQAIKKWVNTEGIVAIIISAVVTIAVVFWHCVSEPTGFNLLRFIVLAICVFLQANGFYHFGSYAIGKVVAEKTKEKKKE
jgi:hypothetical protein